MRLNSRARTRAAANPPSRHNLSTARLQNDLPCIFAPVFSQHLTGNSRAPRPIDSLGNPASRKLREAKFPRPKAATEVTSQTENIGDTRLDCPKHRTTGTKPTQARFRRPAQARCSEADRGARGRHRNGVRKNRVIARGMRCARRRIAESPNRRIAESPNRRIAESPKLARCVPALAARRLRPAARRL
jgi:hypothetical protein